MSFLILNLNKTDQKRFRKLGRAAFPQNHLSDVSESPFYPQNGVSDDSETSFCPHFTCPTCRTVHFMFISSFPTSRTPHLTLISPIRRVGNPILRSFHPSDVSETPFCIHFAHPTCRKLHLTLISPIRRVGNNHPATAPRFHLVGFRLSRGFRLSAPPTAVLWPRLRRSVIQNSKFKIPHRLPSLGFLYEGSLFALSSRILLLKVWLGRQYTPPFTSSSSCSLSDCTVLLSCSFFSIILQIGSCHAT